MSYTDPTKFEAMYREHRAKVVSLCRSLSGNRQDAEDLAQETFVRAWRNRDRLDATANVRSYLLTIATRLWFDVKRERGRRVQPVSLDAPRMFSEEEDMFHQVVDPHGATDARILEQASADAVIEAAKEFLGDDIDILTLRADGWQFDEVAEMKQLPVGTVRSRMWRLKQRLAKAVRA